MRVVKQDWSSSWFQQLISGLWAPAHVRECALGRGDNSLRHRLRILLQAVVDLDPIHLRGDPDVLGRLKGVAVVEAGERHAGRRAVGAPGKQPRAAFRAKYSIEPR